jgi:serine phosphatase RsbU (regulator of sigma subunit)
MRLSTKHRPNDLALAARVVLALAAAIASSAFAGVAPARAAGLPLPGLITGAQSGSSSSSSSSISIEVPHVVGVQLETPALGGEAASLPTVELPGVLTVETKASAPSSEAPPLAKVEVSTPPVVSVPEVTLPPVAGATTTTKATQAPKAAEPAGQSTSSSQTATTATVAGDGEGTGTGTSAASAPAPAAGASSRTPTSRARRSTRSDRASASDRHAAASSRPGATATRAALGASRPPSTPRAATDAAPARKTKPSASSSDPLSSLGRRLALPLPVPDWSKPIILLLLLLAIAFATRSQLAARRARRLERQRGVLLEDLGAMQAALVPEIPARLETLSVSVAYQPADGPAAGGDFYDLIVLAPGKVAIVLGDVVGHGRDALTRAALTRYTLRAYLQAGLEPRAVLALASSVLTEPGEKQFATVVVGVHDSASGRLTYASAGHPPPISVGFETPEPVTICSSAPLCCDLPTGLRQTTISLPAAGQVCFYSDGLPEARVPDGLLGHDRLVELAREPGPPLAADALLERVGAVAQTARDDMIACIISPAERTPPTAAAAATVEELEVDREMLDSSRVARFPQACGVGENEAATLLAGAAKLIAADGTALLRIERSLTGTASGTALPGKSARAQPPALSAAPQRDEAALALRGAVAR